MPSYIIPSYAHSDDKHIVEFSQNNASSNDPIILVEAQGGGNQEGIRISFPDNTNIGSAAEFISFFANGAEVGTIEGGTSGNAGDVVLDGFASDLRLKRDIVYLSSSYDALGLINDIDVIEYEYINEASPTPIRHVGYSAQNLLEVFPNPVRTYDDKNERDGLSPGDHGYRYHKVHYERMTPLLTQAIKELTAKIEALEARIQVLENN